jgi:protein SCO1/2
MPGPTNISTLRLVRWVTLGLIAVLVAGIAVLAVRRERMPVAEPTVAGAAALPSGVQIGGPFHLTDGKGQAVSDADFRGRFMLVFFGYTNCPDECPLTLQKMAGALETLGPLAGKVAPLFITVDPARDTPARLASYLGNFDPRITGLTGTNEQIAAVAKAYKVYFSPAEHEASGADLVNHSTFLYLMDPAGDFRALLPSDIDAENLAAALRSAIPQANG